MREAAEMVAHPHPAFDIYPCADDMTLWNVVLTGPAGTPYADGCWHLYLKFPHDYPHTPPEMRFLTRIKHCNVNSTGKVCHSIFGRAYTRETSVATLCACVYGLLLTPDVSDPLDSTLAGQFYDGDGIYEDTIRTFTVAHSNSNLKSRVWWRRHFLPDDQTENTASRICSSCKKPRTTLLRCSGCRAVLYCNRDCQRRDYKTHKKVCVTFPT
jgi:ubiquitin-protein ligase